MNFVIARSVPYMMYVASFFSNPLCPNTRDQNFPTPRCLATLKTFSASQFLLDKEKLTKSISSDIKYGAYFVFAASLALSIFFVYFFLPETKGLSLEDMDVSFEVAHGDHHFPNVENEEKGEMRVEQRE